MKIKFIHAADLHLGRPFRGLKKLPQELFKQIEESAYHSFRQIVEHALCEKVDFILAAGDLFDTSIRSLRAQAYMKNQLERLTKVGIEVYIIHGNHDPLKSTEWQLTWPKGVHTFTSQNVEGKLFKKENKTAAIYGFSYETSQVFENKISEYKKAIDADFHIGLLHGNAAGRSEHDPYAPFTVKELLEKNFDYWALGHIHKREVLHDSPPIVYPGNIQGLHQKETGEKGCVLVEMSKQETIVQFISTAPLLWEEKKISITDIETIDHLISVCEEQLEEVRKIGSTFLKLCFIGHGSLHNYLQDEMKISDLLTFLQEGEDMRNPFVWVNNIKVETTGGWNRAHLKKERHFVSELLRTIDNHVEIDQVLSSLYRHRRTRLFLDEPTLEDKQEILKEAEEYLLSSLLKER